MSKVYDCCIVYEEIDMLELRFSILKDVVSNFIVVEAGETHSGLPKGHPVGDALQTARFAPFAEKIIYQFAPTLAGANAWERERDQRGLIGGVLQYFAQPDDWVIVGDTDEIAHPNAVSAMRDTFTWDNTTAIKLELDFYYYDVLHRVRQGWAIGACKWKVQQDANKIRTCDFGDANSSAQPLTFDRAGWHFSYFGDAAAIMRKAKAFMHHDWVESYGLTEDKVQAALDAGTDLWGRALQIDRVPLNDSLPKYVLEHRAKYAALGWLEREAEKA